MGILKQSTAITFIVGPILDSAGAAKTDEVVGSIKVTKNGTVGAAHGSATLTHDHAGKYKLALTANDTDTVGVLEISLNSGTNDMAIQRFNVVEEAIYDSMFASGASAVDANVTKLAGDATAATRLKHMANAVVSGTVATDGSNSATSFKTDLTETATDYFGGALGGCVLVFISGANNAVQARRISAYNGTTKFVTVESAFDATPTDGDTFVILGRIEI